MEPPTDDRRSPPRRHLRPARARLATRVRLGALLLLLPVAGVGVVWADPSAPAVAGVAVAGSVLAGASLLDDARSRRRTTLVVAADLAAVALVWVVAAGWGGPGWLALVLPVAEAAYRLPRPAAALFAGGGAAALSLGAVAADDGGAVATELATRAGAVGLVALVVSSLTAELTREADRLARARIEGERRAELLALVVDAGRRLTTLDADETVAVLGAETSRLPFDGVAVVRRSREGPAVEVRRWPGRHAGAVVGAAARHADRRRGTCILSAERIGAELGRPVDGVRTVLAVPVVAGEHVEAVVVVARRHGPPPPLVVQTVELLAGQAAIALGHARTLAEAERLRLRVTHEALHDHLTGLPNRANFDRLLRRRLAVADGGLAVVFVDLDGFKEVNDTLGHRAGDVLLEAAGSRLRATVRPTDTVARLGGDEFVVLVDPTESASAARVVARRLVDVLIEPFTADGRRCRISASAGVAFTPDRRAEPDELVRRADAAMYRAKRAGPGRVVVDDGCDLRPGPPGACHDRLVTGR